MPKRRDPRPTRPRPAQEHRRRRTHSRRRHLDHGRIRSTRRALQGTAGDRREPRSWQAGQHAECHLRQEPTQHGCKRMTREAAEFWEWFSDNIAPLEFSDFSETVADKLDGAVKGLGDLVWEVGPAPSDPSVRNFALSPGGDPDLLTPSKSCATTSCPSIRCSPSRRATSDALQGHSRDPAAMGRRPGGVRSRRPLDPRRLRAARARCRPGRRTALPRGRRAFTPRLPQVSELGV